MSPIVLASWNVNSIRVRLEHVLAYLEATHPDVMGLQETKVDDRLFPRERLEEAGYRVQHVGTGAYSGVALLSREHLEDLCCALPGDEEMPRLISAFTCGMRIVNIYAPNGQAIDSPKYEYKIAWFEKLRHHLQYLDPATPTVVMGDFNVAPTDLDVHDPQAWRERLLCSTRERQALQAIMALGFEDTFRLHHPDERQYSWWDYRQGAFRRNLGLRIDLILANEAARRCCIAGAIDKLPRSWERPSDHAPVLATFSLTS
jgi:exodeoxyribonuclease-3